MAFLQTNELFKQELASRQHRLTDEETEKMKKEVYGILLDVVSVCEEEEIPYMLGGGSCLGAVRHNGFIPWDDDIDLNIPRKYIKRLLSAVSSAYGDRYYIEEPVTTEGYLSSFIQIHKNGTVFQEYLVQKPEHCGIKLDIFVIENTYNKKWKRQLHGLKCEAGLLFLSCYRMYAWRDEFFPLAAGSRKAEAVVRIKAAIGKIFASRSDQLYHKVQFCLQECRDETSDYVVIPSGRGHFFGEMYERRTFMKLIWHTFEGRKFLITADYDHYLTNIYGDYMVLPPENKREHHVIYQLKF